MFSRNSAGFGAAVIAALDIEFTNCSFGGNLPGHAICHTPAR